jgi:hypothetical protein
MFIGLVLIVGAGAAMVMWNRETPVSWIVAVNAVTGAGIALTLVASASEALAQFAPAEAGTGSALFNSLRQLGAAMGVAVPAVAFEFAAGGARTPGASLEGSTAAFAIRTLVLAIPLLLVAAQYRYRTALRARAGRAT